MRSIIRDSAGRPNAMGVDGIGREPSFGSEALAGFLSPNSGAVAL
ncbi:hypothetical protein [Aureimonas psammosilenae]|nr:hypothetical protein [Aureimonas psammosilenae]